MLEGVESIDLSPQADPEGMRRVWFAKYSWDSGPDREGRGASRHFARGHVDLSKLKVSQVSQKSHGEMPVLSWDKPQAGERGREARDEISQITSRRLVELQCQKCANHTDLPLSERCGCACAFLSSMVSIDDIRCDAVKRNWALQPRTMLFGGIPMAPSVIIIGAGPAGLATGAALRQRGVTATILEAGDTPGYTWSRLYERLHLHTVKALSGLPGLAMPRDFPRYPSRAQVTEYLIGYADHFHLSVQTGCRAERAWHADDGWHVTVPGSELRADMLVSATGIFSQPYQPILPGAEIFRGHQMHASTYFHAAPFAGQRMLVIGAGNSGAEIAIDLAEHGIATTVAIRAGTSVVPRDLFGIPIQRWAHLLAAMSPGMQRVFAPILARRSAQRQARAGVPRATGGLLGRQGIPIIGLDFLRLAQTGMIAIAPGVAELTEDGARFADGQSGDFTSIIYATGYRPALSYLGDDLPRDAAGRPRLDGLRALDLPNLYCVGLHGDVRGTLFNIAHEAPVLAQQIVAQSGWSA